MGWNHQPEFISENNCIEGLRPTNLRSKDLEVKLIYKNLECEFWKHQQNNMLIKKLVANEVSSSQDQHHDP